MREQKLKRLITSIITIAIATYLGYGVLLYFAQRSFLYYPTDAIDDTAQMRRSFRLDDVTINAWVTHPGHKEAMIFFGGNAMNAYYAIPQVERTLKNTTGYLVDYRGYGHSTGTPTEEGILKDALRLHDILTEEHEKITVVGRSLGTGVAAHVASLRELYGLVLITPYDSIESVAGNHYPVYPISLLLKDKYDTVSIADTIDERTLVLMADKDTVIPKAHSLELIEHMTSAQLEVHTLSGTGHNTISAKPVYERLIRDFIEAGYSASAVR